MTLMNGGQALVKALEGEGVRVVFGLPGAGQYEGIDAIYSSPSIRYFTTRHEQATTYMADGYSRASGEIATAMVVPGPGLFNAFAGMATAYAVSSPMLVVSGTRHQEKAPNGEVEMGGFGHVAGWSGRAAGPGEIPGLVQSAFATMRGARPRPTLLEIPSQVFSKTGDVQVPAAPRIERPMADADRVSSAAQVLIAARKPLIWAGGGVHSAEANELLLALAESIGAPVITTEQGKGAISDRHPLALGYAELRYEPLAAWLADCDVILAVGTRRNFAGMVAGAQVVQIDIDEAQIGQDSMTYALVGDAKKTLDALLGHVQRAGARGPEGARGAERVQALAVEVAALKGQRFDPARQLQPQWGMMQAIRAAMPDDGILVQDMNQMGYYSRNYFPVYAPQSFFTASQLGTLGAAFPIALGAKVARPERAVVALCGDGGFLYCAQELATAVQYGIHVVAIVFNDNAYGNVMRAQEEQFDGRVLGTKLHNPDFVKLAEAYGAAGVRAEGAAMLEQALREALQRQAPTLIEVPVGPMQRQF